MTILSWPAGNPFEFWNPDDCSGLEFLDPDDRPCFLPILFFLQTIEHVSQVCGRSAGARLTLIRSLPGPHVLAPQSRQCKDRLGEGRCTAGIGSFLDHGSSQGQPLPLLQPSSQAGPEPGQQVAVEAVHSLVEGEDPEKKETLQTVGDYKAENNDPPNIRVIFSEHHNDAKNPGDSEQDKDTKIDEEVGAPSVAVLAGLCQRGDVVDAGDSQAVEDDVGQAHKDHGNTKGDECCVSHVDPALGRLAVHHGEIRNEATVVDDNTDANNDKGNAKAIGDIAGKVDFFRPDVGENGSLAECLVDIPGHHVGPEEDCQVGEVNSDGHSSTEGLAHTGFLTAQKYNLEK